MYANKIFKNKKGELLDDSWERIATFLPFMHLVKLNLVKKLCKSLHE
jgi:hypothetical protein